MTQNSSVARDAGALGAASIGVGTALTTVAAGACCASALLSPVIIGVIGASGAAWAVGLKPYTGYLLAGSFLFLGAAFWMVYRSRPACAVEDGPPPRVRRWMPVALKAVLWGGAALWLFSLALQFLAS